MASEVLPIFKNSTDYEYTCAIDGRDFVFRFFLGSRQDRWYVSVFTPQGDPLISGQRVAYFTDIFNGVVTDDFFEGQVVPIRLDNKDTEPTEEDFNLGLIVLLYLTGEDQLTVDIDSNYVESIVKVEL
jgi:hypothetical protein